MDHLWYCNRCYMILFMPWLNGQHDFHNRGIVITQIEQPCVVCKDTTNFSRVK